MTARQFGRDTGDTYGRHALVNPGGDNVQRDVLHVIDHWIHPTLVADGYVGCHRTLGNWLFSVEAMTQRAESNR